MGLLSSAIALPFAPLLHSSCYFSVFAWLNFARSVPCASTTPRRRPTRIALQARAVAHEREIVALGAGFARIALHPRLRAQRRDARLFGRHGPIEFAELRLDLV